MKRRDAVAEPYLRGTWYPAEARAGYPRPNARRIYFTQMAVAARGLQNELSRWAKILKSVGPTGRATGFWIEVVRRKPGLLQYRICVELETDDDATDEFEDALAARVVRWFTTT